MQNWKSIRRIARGGQGTIFCVRNEDSGENAILKKANSRRNSNERIEREILILMTLQDSNYFPKIIKYNINTQPYSYIMEYGGVTLYEYIESLMKHSSNYYLRNLRGDGKKTGSFYAFFITICKLFEQILYAVQELHNRNIVHRDLKPRNILVKNGNIKLIDFGIAYNYDKIRLTLDHERVGSFYYMAPENAEGKNITPNEKQDFYSLGKILYFLLSKGRIFDREKFRDEEYDLRNLYDDARFDFFNNYFDKTINENPSERYTTINELIENFMRIQKDFWQKRRNYFDIFNFFEIFFELEYDNIEEGHKQTIEFAKKATEELGKIMIQRNHIYYQLNPHTYSNFTSPVYQTVDELNEKYGQLIPFYVIEDECRIVIVLYLWFISTDDLAFIEANSEYRIIGWEFNNFENSGYNDRKEYQKHFEETFEYMWLKREKQRTHSLARCMENQK